MSGFGFFILFGLNCIFSCEGLITSPRDGTNHTFLPGSTNSITWTFDDDATKVVQQWFFNSSTEGSQDESLAAITFNGPPQEQKDILPRFNITKPGTLFLINVDESYDGTYTFQIRPFESKVRVFIAKKPTVTVCPSPLMINENEDGSCVCRGDNGNPPASVVWLDKNNKQIGEKRIRENTLTLTNVDETDDGIYKCVAESYPDENYKDEKTIQVVVRLNFKPKDTKIKFSRDSAVVGGSFTILCESNGLPEPDFIIFHNGSELQKAKNYTIDEVGYTHAGTYKCVAVNKLGNHSDSSVVKVVATEPRQKPTPTKSSTIPSASTTSSGGGVKAKPDDDKDPDGLSDGAIAGICIGALALVVIIAVVVYCFFCKHGEKDGYRGKRDVSPGGRNDNQYEMGDNEYDTVKPGDGGEGSGEKPKKKNQPPVYAQVDKENRQGKPLYATLDTVALDSGGSKKRDEGRAQPTEYAAIDHSRTGDVPRADLV